MRFNLEGLEGKRCTFTAVFWQYGTFCSHCVAGRTILLKFVRDVKGNLLADHMWINYTRAFDAVGEFRQGEFVSFDASVGKYIKGYFGERIEDRLDHPAREDYRLKFPHHVKKLGYGYGKTREVSVSPGRCTKTVHPGGGRHVPQ